MFRFSKLLLVVIVSLGWCDGIRAEAIEECLIAEGGKARLGVIVAPTAAPQTRQAAEDLAAMLGAISGAKIPLSEGTEATPEGVWVGTAEDFPDLSHPLIRKGDHSDREAFWIHSDANRVRLIGWTPLGVQNGVWALLHDLGVRQFFPGKTWEIIPHAERLAVKISRQDRPDYFTRRMVLMVGKYAEGTADFQEWQKRNLAVSGFDMAVGHSYGRIVKRNEEEFRAHPEYLVDPDTRRDKMKFRIDNPALRSLVVRDAMRQIHDKPELDCIALDPSDGGGWPEDSPLGSVSNQVVTLANSVARGLREKYPAKRVTFYAYHQHSPPPTVEVEPEVIVNVATAFMTDGWTVQRLLRGWRERGAVMGIRDYLSVSSWDNLLPGRSRAADLNYLKANFPAWHQDGARYYETEAHDSWGPCGLGYYLAHRLLWNVHGADQLDEWVDDFLEKSFGSAKAPMKRFFESFDGRKPPLFSEHLLGKMYRQLKTALEATEEPDVRKRIEDYIKYVRYTELYRAYELAEASQRQATFEACVKFAWRIRESRMVAPGTLNYRESRRHRKTIKEVTITPLREADREKAIDVAEILENGIRNNRVLEFESVAYGAEWAPPETLLVGSAASSSESIQLRGENELVVYLDKSQPTLKLTVTGGLIRTQGVNVHRGPVRLSLIPLAHPLHEAVAEAEIPADLQSHVVELSSEYSGTHRLLINDGNDLTELSWEKGAHVGIPSGGEKKVALYSQTPYSLFFPVPKGTRKVVGYADSSRGWVEFPDGRKAFDFRKANAREYFSVDVPPGMDGKLWRLVEVTGERLLLTTPPMLFRSAEEQLAPETALP